MLYEQEKGLCARLASSERSIGTHFQHFRNPVSTKKNSTNNGIMSMDGKQKMKQNIEQIFKSYLCRTVYGEVSKQRIIFNYICNFSFVIKKCTKTSFFHAKFVSQVPRYILLNFFTDNLHNIVATFKTHTHTHTP